MKLSSPGRLRRIPAAVAVMLITVSLSVIPGCGSGTQAIYESDNEKVIALKKMGIIVFEGAMVGPNDLKYEIDFSKTSLSPAAWDIMKEMTVDTLKLKGTDFSDADIERLKDHERLRVLDLTETGISDASLETLLEVGRLSELTLCGTAVTNEGLKTLSNAKRLSHLNLMDTQVTDAGLEYLKELPNLNILVLSGNSGITDFGMEQLADCPRLAMLGVYDTQVTSAGIKKLKASRPGLMAMGAGN